MEQNGARNGDPEETLARSLALSSLCDNNNNNVKRKGMYGMKKKGGEASRAFCCCFFLPGPFVLCWFVCWCSCEQEVVRL